MFGEGISASHDLKRRKEKRRGRSTASFKPGGPMYAPSMMTVPEVCQYLRISRATLYRLLRRSDIPAFRVSKRDWRFAVQDLAGWVEKQSEESGK